MAPINCIVAVDQAGADYGTVVIWGLLAQWLHITYLYKMHDWLQGVCGPEIPTKVWTIVYVFCCIVFTWSDWLCFQIYNYVMAHFLFPCYQIWWKRTLA